ncbi:hypothetical protein Tco_0627864 [Tanacetum coccineum]|uniref:RNA-directed DNA polymerase, eukaryota n=1 Tax=Tanacetum coccineum TaxID=301880 RepID=A0ABQ4WNN9_9ASTR
MLKRSTQWLSEIHRHLSDHRPILLREVRLDFGPTPFRFYHSWLDMVGFDDMINSSWKSFSHTDENRLICFKKKLQELKVIIRSWTSEKKRASSCLKSDLTSELGKIDKDLESGIINDDQILCRLELKRKLLNITEMEAKDNLQKSKLKWAVEGDENSKFFHGIINKRRSQLAIRGIFVEGIWRTQPTTIKDTFFKHFGEQFQEPAVHSNGKARTPFEYVKKVLRDDLKGIDYSWKLVAKYFSKEVMEVVARILGDVRSDSFDYLFDTFQQFEKLVNSSRAKKLEKSHDPLALVAYTGSSSRNTSSYYVTHPMSVVDYDDEYQQDDVQTNSEGS